MKYLLGVDFGGSSSKATLLREDGVVAATASREYPTYYPENGWAEQDAEDSYNAACANIRELLEKTGVAPTPPFCWARTTGRCAGPFTGRTPGLRPKRRS